MYPLLKKGKNILKTVKLRGSSVEMKKIVFLVMAFLFAIFQTAYANNNMIYEINAEKAPDSVHVNIKSDYGEKIKTVRENRESVYFDIKDTKLSDNFKTDTKGDISLVCQQINSKVRVYIKGESVSNLQTNIVAIKGQKPFDYGNFAIILGVFCVISFIAIRFYSATISLATYKTSIKTPKMLYSGLSDRICNYDRHPEIVYSKTNPVKSDVYVDFEYLKNRKNVKVAL